MNRPLVLRSSYELVLSDEYAADYHFRQTQAVLMAPGERQASLLKLQEILAQVRV